MEVVEGKNHRGKWNGRIEYLISTIGYAVDLGNVFRFPYICYKNHGGAFLLPYFIMTILIAFPMYMMEYILGQYYQQGALTMWEIVPVIKGIGWVTIIVNLIIGLYYNAIISWAAFYIYSSFKSPIPWISCNNTWNVNCNASSDSEAAQQFFENKLFNKHNTPDDILTPQNELVLSLFFTYVILYLCVFKGTKSLGKVAWITSLLPYIVLILLFAYALNLPNAVDGIIFFVTPNLKTLQSFQVWIDAASQIFFSMGLGVGVHITFASYNPKNSPILSNCCYTMLANCFTSIFSGFVVFAYLGHFSGGKEINNENGDHYGMVMIIYSAVLSRFKYPQVFCVLFFTMILSLGIDSSFGALEALIAAILDYFKNFFGRFKYSREILTAFTLLLYFAISIPLTCPIGLLLISLMDEIVCTVTLLLIGLLECLIIGWIYGVYELTDNLKKMTGRKIWIGFGITIKFICPTILTIILLTLFQHEESDDKLTKIKISSSTKLTVKIIMAVLPLILMAAFGLHEWFKMRKRGTKKQVLGMLLSPKSEHAEILQTDDNKRLHKKHWFRLQ